MTQKLTAAQRFRMSLVFTGFMVYLSYSLFASSKNEAAHSAFTATTAKITRSRQYEGTKRIGLVFLPQLDTDVEYAFSVNGKQYAVTKTFDSITSGEFGEKYGSGQTAEIRYNPNNPSEVVTDADGNSDLSALSLAFAGAAVAGLFLSSFFYFESRKPRDTKSNS